jgi:uncharacterized LabA/DUF88 family protein
VDRCALFVDASYLLADGAMAVHGTRRRESVSWDYAGLLQLLGNLARERTGLPLLRCYWYEATVEGRRSPEHDALADLPGIKLRLSRIRPGRREGVDTEIHRDLMTLARNGGVADAVVVSGDEDIAQVIADAQDHGVRVSVLHVAVDGNWTISRVLRHECDDLIEIGSAHLRPYVNLLAGVDTSTPPLSNGHASSGGTLAPLQPSSQHVSPPPSSPITAPPPHLGGGSTMSGLGQSSGSDPVIPPLRSAPTHSAPTPPLIPPKPASAPPSGPSSGRPGSSSGNTSGSQYAQQPVGPYTGPQQIPPPQAQQSTPTLSDAVKAAHQEGQDFGESVARDAPALWLEAVLARKPRMPSDLEARLLQGSSLPIDFLLHDEVRHALRRGFWDALERSRRV